jgi:hypothetical protein
VEWNFLLEWKGWMNMATPKILNPEREPGDTEFSHGKGLMPDPRKGYEPDNLDEHHAILRTDSADPTSVANYDKVVRAE